MICVSFSPSPIYFLCSNRLLYWIQTLPNFWQQQQQQKTKIFQRKMYDSNFVWGGMFREKSVCKAAGIFQYREKFLHRFNPKGGRNCMETGNLLDGGQCWFQLLCLYQIELLILWKIELFHCYNFHCMDIWCLKWDTNNERPTNSLQSVHY